MKTHEQWLEEVVRIAVENVERGGGPFAALVVRGGEVVGQGVNEVQVHSDPTAHAELLAIREACTKLNSTDLSDSILYASGEPCPMCMGAIYWAKPKAVYFACSKKEAGQAAGFPDPLGMFYEEMYSRSRTPEERSVPVYKLAPANHLAPFHRWKSQSI
jgi:guanine deaminase